MQLPKYKILVTKMMRLPKYNFPVTRFRLFLVYTKFCGYQKYGAVTRKRKHFRLPVRLPIRLSWLISILVTRFRIFLVVPELWRLQKNCGYQNLNFLVRTDQVIRVGTNVFFVNTAQYFTVINFHYNYQKFLVRWLPVDGPLVTRFR